MSKAPSVSYPNLMAVLQISIRSADGFGMYPWLFKIVSSLFGRCRLKICSRRSISTITEDIMFLASSRLW